MKTFLLILFVLLNGCSSSDKKVFVDGGETEPLNECGIDSFVNQFGFYNCSALELSDNNKYINQDSPLHKINGIALQKRIQFLVVEEKLFNTQAQATDNQILCTRRLKVILSPGSGRNEGFQSGWLTYSPNCMTFFKADPSDEKNIIDKILSRTAI